MTATTARIAEATAANAPPPARKIEIWAPMEISELVRRRPAPHRQPAKPAPRDPRCLRAASPPAKCPGRPTPRNAHGPRPRPPEISAFVQQLAASTHLACLVRRRRPTAGTWRTWTGPRRSLTRTLSSSGSRCAPTPPCPSPRRPAKARSSGSLSPRRPTSRPSPRRLTRVRGPPHPQPRSLARSGYPHRWGSRSRCANPKRANLALRAARPPPHTAKLAS